MSESIPLDPDRGEGALDADDAAALADDDVERRASETPHGEDESEAGDDERGDSRRS